MQVGGPSTPQERRFLSLQGRDPLPLQFGGEPPTLQASILKNYTYEQIQDLLANNQQFRIVFGGEFAYTEVWREKSFLEFSTPTSFFDLAQGRISTDKRYLEIATYHVLSPDSLRICDKVYLYMEARRRADEKAEKYFSGLLTWQEKQYAKEESYVPVLLEGGGDYEDEDYRSARTEQGDEIAFEEMLRQNDDLLVESAITSGRVDFVNRALILRFPNLPRNFNLEDYVVERPFDPNQEHVHVRRLPPLLKNVLLSDEELDQDYASILQSAIASFNLNILDFFLALYIDYPSVEYELENFVERYRVTRDVITAYSILQRIKHSVSGDGLVTLAQTGNTDLYLLVAKSRRYHDAVHAASIRGQIGNYLFVKAIQDLMQV
ncbi:Hypothetical protein BQ3484_226 [Cedratvirus A11]|uniref:Uncharacterized protein n=1 Tax=Cedratvirus A11 TaxID=1903266 RepID=A0A1M7XUC0_9VIRU|nr:Hypothetical protein BQ3484_226 [Cedratvirus A11]SHO33294.1 Hypothetical protein BQ3484_226 [Cedratvirus A11]